MRTCRPARTPNPMLSDALHLVESGQNLSMALMAETLGQIMDGQCSEDEIERLLVALHEKGETVAEIAGAAAAMRQRMTPIRSVGNCRRKFMPSTFAWRSSGSTP